MTSTSSNVAYGNVQSSVQANTINGSVHIGINDHVGFEDSLGRLPRAEEAPFNTFTNQHEPICLPDTRVTLLNAIHDWADGDDERGIFWLSGMAGTGKSTIARTVARRYLDEERLAATFFFSRGGGDVGHAGKFVTSIAIQLAHSVPAAGRHIGEAVAKRSNIASQSLRDQWEQLIIHPLCRLDVTTKALETYVVVVDALDECDNDSNIGMIVELLAEARPLMATRLRVLLTSRPEVPIRHGFGQVSEVEHVNVVLHDIERSIVDQDICTFLEDRLQSVRRERGLQVDWPGRRVITQLVQHASGLFIWAATACRFIRDGKRFAAKRLEMIMSTGNESRTATAPEKRLDQIYVTVLQNSVSEDFTDEERDEQYEMLKYVLGGIVMLSIPLSERSLSALLGIADEDVRQTLTDLHAILHIPKDPTQRLRLHHPSFRDFLLNTDRCGVDFWVNKRMIHEKLAFGCIQLMSGPNGLRQNICGLSELGSLRSEMGKETSAVHLSPELSYACWRWVEHLDSSNLSIVDGDTVHLFLRTHLLHWLEAMIFLGGMDPAYIGSSKCLHSLGLLESLSASGTCVDFLRDAQRFVKRSIKQLRETPLQLYASALIFAPESSLVRRNFVKQVPQAANILLGRDPDWDAGPGVSGGHTRSVSAVAFSRDGRLLASASHDTTVRVWETATGTCRHELKGHTDWATAIAFSPDGQLIASASVDSTVRMWETASGTCRRTLTKHEDWVTAIAFSPGGQLLASASADGTLRVWEEATGACKYKIAHSTEETGTIVFSPDGNLFASASTDGFFSVWKTATGTCVFQRGMAYGVWFSAIAFSPDGQLLATACYNETVRLWEAATNTWMSCGELTSPYERIRELSFSRDGSVVHTNEGDITLPVSIRQTSHVKQEEEFVHLLAAPKWVLRNSRRTLWLPYQHRTTAVCKDMVALGCFSGRVILLRLR